jgi:hypothetical protein
MPEPTAPAPMPEPPPAAPAPPPVPGVAPKPVAAAAALPPSPLDQKLSQESADIQAQREKLKQPEPPKSNWAQRLGLAVLSMTKLAPAANQIVHPKWAAEESNYERGLSDLAAREKGVNAQVTTGAQAAYKEAMAQQAALTGESRLENAATRTLNEQTRAKEAADKIAQLASTAYQKSITERLKGREQDTVYQQKGAPMPPGYEFIENKEEPGMGWAAPPAWRATPAELLPFAPGYQAGDQMPHSAFKAATDAYNKDKLAKDTAAGKPEPAAAAKQHFQETMNKVAGGGFLQGGAVTDVAQQFKALDAAAKAGVITPEEQANGKAFLATNPSPASTGTNVTVRTLGQEESRVFPVINTETHNTEMRNAREINEHPGLYASASAGGKALTQEAVFQDLHYNIETARRAINSLDEIDAKTRAQLAYVLRHTDPTSAAQAFLTGAAGTTLTDQQQEAVQALAQLSENALTLRQIGGFGAGSDDLRAAIQATLPNAKSPTKGYMLGQLSKFENVVKRLEHGVPGLGKTAPQAGGPATQPPDGQQKTATMAHVREFARQQKPPMSDVAAKKMFTDSGYVITEK